ncbi:MAG: N-acetyltransferase family protein [Burkholderiales bacterium]
MTTDSVQTADPVGFSMRSATPDDLPLVLSFIRELAEYEHLSHMVTATEAGLRAALFGSRPAAEVILGFAKDEPAGFAVYFWNFSTFLGLPGLWLEDLYVRPHHRRRGYGRALLLEVAAMARDRGCGRFEWAALDWNVSAIRFYRALGALPLDDWTTFRVTGKSLDHLVAMRRNKGT